MQIPFTPEFGLTPAPPPQYQEKPRKPCQPLLPRECSQCSVTFKPTSQGSIYCSHRCASVGKTGKKRGPNKRI